MADSSMTTAEQTQLERLAAGISGDAPIRPTVAVLARIVKQQADTIADLAERLTALEAEVGYPLPLSVVDGL